MDVKKLIKYCLPITILFILNGCGGKRQEVFFSPDMHLPSKDGVVNVMTFNIRVDTILDAFRNSWNKRKSIVFNVLRDNHPEVIGLQEALYSQIGDIQQALPEYDYYAVGRDDGQQDGETCAIFYRKDLFELTDSGTFWFSDTPDVPGSKDWGNIWPRLCSWVHLTEKKTGTGFYVYNVHLACFSQNSREKSVQLLARRVALRKKSDPFIVTGDFNMGLDNSAMQYLQKNGYNTPYPKMVDAWQSVHSDKEYSGTYKSQKGPKLDHIPISENLLALDVKIDQRKENGRYPSDHFPVIAKILLNKPMFSQLKWNERTFE